MADDEKSLEQLEAENELKREGIRLDEKALATVEKVLKAKRQAAAEQRKADAEAAKRQNESIEARRSALALDEEELQKMEEKNVNSLRFTANLEHQEEIANKRMEMQQEFVSLQEAELKAARESDNFSKDELAIMEQSLKASKRVLKTNQKKLETGREAIGQGKTMIKNLGEPEPGQSKVGKGIVSGVKGLHSMWKMAKGLTLALRAGAISAGMLTSALGIGIILLVVGAIAKLVEITIGLTLKTRDAQYAFRRATGAAMKYAVAVPRLEHSMRAVGVSMEEANAAQMALYSSTTDYTMASDEARDSLLQTTALMAEFGVSVQTSAKIAQAATKGMGMGLEEADDLLLRLSASATDLNVPISAYTESFATNAETLKKWGRDGERVFHRMMNVQKLTGIEVGRLLDIVGKFDTFEGAAKQAGQLNAALGGNFVNAMDLMMETDPEKRFMMMRDAIDQTGLSFDEMSYYQKNFFKDALNLKDVGELAAFMSGDMSELGNGMNKTSAEFAAQREKAKNWQSTMDALKNTLMAALPMFEGLAGTVQQMVEEFTKGEGPLKDLGKTFEKIMMDIIAPALAGNPPAIVKGVMDIVSSIKSFGKYVKENALPMLNTLKSIMMAIGLVLAVVAWKFVAVTAVITMLIEFIGDFQDAGKKRYSPSFFDIFTGGVLEKGVQSISDALYTLGAPIRWLGEQLGKLRDWFNDTFSFDNIKDKVKGFVSWLPGTWAESVMGIKTEMEIASPSKKMEREVIDPTFVAPMKSVAAKMPGLVDDVYKDVSLEKSTAPLKSASAELATTVKNDTQGAIEPMDLQTAFSMTSIGGTMETITRAMTNMAVQNKNQAVAAIEAMARGEMPQESGGGGPTNTTVTIPIQIGNEKLGTVVADIVDGKLGNVALRGALGIG